MKTTVFFALALAAVLLGLRQDPSQPHERPAGRNAGTTVPRMPASDPAAAAGSPPARAPAPPVQETASPMPALAGEPAPTPPQQPASVPALPAAPMVATGDTDGASDWRDNALDLLSQIGLLCPAAGCDSLEDD